MEKLTTECMDETDSCSDVVSKAAAEVKALVAKARTLKNGSAEMAEVRKGIRKSINEIYHSYDYMDVAASDEE
jgi:hypothetical protein